LLCFSVLSIIPLHAQRNTLPRLAIVGFSVNSTRTKVLEDTIVIRDLVQSDIVASGKFEVIARAEIDQLLVNQRIPTKIPIKAQKTTKF
jgi:hypothetical protein